MLPGREWLIGDYQLGEDSQAASLHLGNRLLSSLHKQIYLRLTRRNRRLDDRHPVEWHMLPALGEPRFYIL